MENKFTHLHVHTEYSMLDSSAKIKELVKKAVNQGMKALAITDHGNLYGVLKFYKCCKENNIKPIIGCEFYITENVVEKTKTNNHIVLLAKNEIGYRNLLKLLNIASNYVYFKPRIDKDILKKHKEGLICLSACIAGEIPQAILKNNNEQTEALIEEYKELFGDDFYLEVQDHFIPEQKNINEYIFNIASKKNVKVIATNDVHYVEKSDAKAQDILICIQTNKVLSDTNRLKFGSDEFYFKTYDEMFALFQNKGGCLSNTQEIVDKCNVEIETNKNLTPSFPKLPTGVTEDDYLRELCYKNLDEKYPDKTEEIINRLEYELEIISKMKYSGYFLIVQDFINFALENNISIGPGRGSAVGSIVTYLTNITNLEPLRFGLLFERFLNPERVSMPDIDTDIDDKNRYKVVKYMMETYGYEKSAQIVTFAVEGLRSAIRDVARVLEIEIPYVEDILSLIPKDINSLSKAMEVDAFINKYNSDNRAKQLIDYSLLIEGLPRQTSTHAAGVVISQDNLDTLLPVEMKEDGLHTQLDKDEVEEIGLLKMDLLGLKNLSIEQEAIELIKKNKGIEIDINKIPLDDKKTFDMLSEGDTLGVFQLESNGMIDIVKRLKPNRFEDIISLVALYRPGPLGSGMVDDFINGKHGANVEYLHPLLEPILEETFGVMLYQEQVMQVASKLANFSLGKADILRRAMGKKKAKLLEAQKIEFIKGATDNNIDEKLADEIFTLMAHFADYGFNKSHSAAYAFIAYQTAYLKAHYPQEFMASYMSNNLDKPEKIKKCINILKNKGIETLPPSIQKSYREFTTENNNIRFGLGAIKNLETNTIDTIINQRAEKSFENLIDFLLRIPISKTNLENLISLNSFGEIIQNKKALLLSLEEIYSETKKYKQLIDKTQKKEVDLLSLFDNSEEFLLAPPNINDFIKNQNVPDFTNKEIISFEKTILGFYVSSNPLDFCSSTLARTIAIEDILNDTSKYINKTVNICGLIEDLKTIITKKQETMILLDLEDAFSNRIPCVLFPKEYILNNSTFSPQDNVALITGKLLDNKQYNKIQIVVEKIKTK